MKSIIVLLIVILIAMLAPAASAEEIMASLLEEMVKREASVLISLDKPDNSDPDMAKELLKKAALYRFIMGQIMEKRGHFKSAKIMYKMALEFDPGNKRAKTALMKFYL